MMVEISSKRRIVFDIFILSEIFSQTKVFFVLKFVFVYISSLAYENWSREILGSKQ